MRQHASIVSLLAALSSPLGEFEHEKKVQTTHDLFESCQLEKRDNTHGGQIESETQPSGYIWN